MSIKVGSIDKELVHSLIRSILVVVDVMTSSMNFGAILVPNE